MKNIDPYNCEAWFLDYYEGRLNESEIELLEQFLADHPEWQEEFTAFAEVEALTIEADNNTRMSEDARNQLYAASDEDDLIALAEGILQPEDFKRVLSDMAKNPGLARTFEQYQLARLTPDTTIRFPNKRSLKKSAPVVVLFQRYAAVAAMLALAFLAVWMFGPGGESLPMAEQSKPKGPVTNEISATETTQSSNQSDLTAESMVVEEAEEHENVQAEIKQASISSPQFDRKELASAQETASDSESPTQQMEIADASNEIQLERISPTRLKQIPIHTNQAQLHSGGMIAAQIDFPEETEPDNNTVRSGLGGAAQSIFGSLIGDIGDALAQRVKNSTKDQVVIEQNEVPEDNLITSTFRLGAFEVYRSRTK